MTIFVAVLLTVLSLVFIAYPFFRQKWSLSASNEDEKFRELHSRQDTTYFMLKELEFDFQSGILTEEDYRDLEVRYKRKAISILKDADNMEKGTEVEGDIEEQVKKLRLVKSSNLNDQKVRRGQSSNFDREVEEEVSKLRKSGGKFCPQCGTKSQEDDRFCASCGVKLR
jgi:hypothetical protein